MENEVEVDEDGNNLEEPGGGEFSSPNTNPVLAPETWDQIFRDVTSTDFLSVINAVPQWHELLSSRRTTELFPMVLPHLIPFLPACKFLPSRGVSRGSKVALDKSLQDTWTSSSKLFHSHFDTANQISSLLSEIKKISTSYTFSTREEIDQFAKAVGLQLDGDLAVSSSNPFLTRSLSVNLEPPPGGDDELAWQLAAGDHARVNRLLFRYGHFIWRFSLNFFQVDSSSVAKLRSYLTRLLHLKILELSGETVPGDGPGFMRGTELPHLGELELENLELSKLKSISLASKLVQRYGAQLNTLVVEGRWFVYSGMETGLLNSLLPKLKRLRVVNVDGKAFAKLSRVNWPLESLQLQLPPSITLGSPFPLDKLLQTTVNSNKSLRTLELHFDKVLLEHELIHQLARSAFGRTPKLEKVVIYERQNEQVEKSVFTQREKEKVGN